MENEEKIKEVRNANDIVEIISSYLPLIKKGKNYFGVCPFHDDNNPSMSVSPDKQIYKCFSCGASGNVFNFVMDYERVDFRESLNILAKKAGISLNNTYVKNNDKYEKFYDIYSLTEKYYQNNLNTQAGLEAKEYLHNRGINNELIKVFKIGLALKDNYGLTNLLIKKNYNIKDLDLIGLANQDKDLFINRIMFPLFNTSGLSVGFSGRIYNMKSDSKYVNTKETPIFKKGELLYNYHNAKEEARRAKSLIIVEGFMDVIRLFSIGIKNVVALMGTSLTKEQIILIKRTSNNIYISLDGDGPGQKATYTVGKQLEDEGLNINIICLKENLDPDEFILKYGKNEYQSLLDNPLTFSDFKIGFLKEGKNLTSIEDQSKYINSVLKEINNITDDIKKELMLKKISLEFNIDIEILRNKLQNMQNYSKIETFKKEPIKLNKLDKYQKATYMILFYMMNNYNAIRLYEKKLNYLPYESARYLANEIIYYAKKNTSFSIADFLTTINDKTELLSLVREILKLDVDDFENLEIINDYISVIDEYKSNQEIKRLKEMMKKEVDPDKKAMIADKIRLVKIGS